MARTWLSVTVELLGGRGEDLWPWPGRVFAVGPSHTFMELADAVNDGFARWDRSHLSIFTLADGRMVTDAHTGAEMAGWSDGPITQPVDIETAKVARFVGPGAEFRFVFDLGDDWTHRCVVGEDKIDPREMLGIAPKRPLPYWGWGSIPDQYGRRWADDGNSRIPKRPAQPHPMLMPGWPGQKQVRSVDLRELRSAVAAGDADRVLAALDGCQVDDVLQQVGSAFLIALERRREHTEPVVLSVINRLTLRAGVGDDVLAEDLLARLRAAPLEGRMVPVDLEMLAAALDADPGISTGGYLDLHTGWVYDQISADPMTVGDDAAIDVDENPDRWVRFDSTGSQDAWDDMACFAERVHDSTLSERLARAIEGKGAFRRFRDLLHQEGLAEQWDAFSTDRRLGRARALLAGLGIRVG